MDEYNSTKGTVEQATVVGKNAYQKMDMNPLVHTAVWNGTEGWQKDARGVRKLDTDDLNILMSSVAVSPLLSAWNEFGNAAIKVLPEETRNGRAYQVLQIAKFDDVKFYLDKETQLLARIVSSHRAPGIPPGESPPACR